MRRVANRIRKFYQDERHRGCLEACLSTVLQEEVPVREPRKRTVTRFLGEMGLDWAWEEVPSRGRSRWLSAACARAPQMCGGMLVVCGPAAPGSRHIHCVVYRDGKFWHDPWRPYRWPGARGDVSYSEPVRPKALILETPQHLNPLHHDSTHERKRLASNGQRR
jgi:hypothetical protein